MSPNVSFPPTRLHLSLIPNVFGKSYRVLNSLLYLISENLGSLIGAGTALEDIVNEHKKKETTDRSKIL